MFIISYISYGLLILYLLYCISFCSSFCIILIQENSFLLLKYTPLRQEDDNIEITHFDLVNEQKLQVIPEY